MWAGKSKFQHSRNLDIISQNYVQRGTYATCQTFRQTINTNLQVTPLTFKTVGKKNREGNFAVQQTLVGGWNEGACDEVRNAY